MSTLVRLLENCRSSPVTQGKLTAQTFTSFHHSSIALPKLVENLTGECGFPMYCHHLYKMILLNTILDYTDRYQDQTTMYRFVKSWKMIGPLNITSNFHKYNSKLP